MPNKQRAERGGNVRAEESKVGAVTAVPVYGANGWRRSAPLGAAYNSDPALRWELTEHRDELNQAGALGLIRGRLFAFEPMFSAALARIARRRAAVQAESRLIRAQSDADLVAEELAELTRDRGRQRAPDQSAPQATGHPESVREPR